MTYMTAVVRRARIAVAVAAAAALLVVAGCSSSGSPSGTTSRAAGPAAPSATSHPPSAAPTGAPGRPGDLTAALRFVPRGTNEVYFTDWAAAGHPHDPMSVGGRFFGGTLSQYSLEVHRRLGAFPTDADWEIEAVPAYSTALRFPRAADLEAIGHGLVTLGWTRTGTATRQTYTCRPGAACQAVQQPPTSWAYKSDFLIDRTAGVLMQYRPSSAPFRPSSTLARSAVVRRLVANAPAPVSADLRVGTAACGDLYAWFRDPPRAAQLRDQLSAVQQGLSRVTGTLVSVDTSTARTGSAAVVLSSPAVARSEAVRRAGLAGQLAKVADTDPSGLTIRSAGTAGPVARYAITADGDRALSDAADSGQVGVDLCPRPIVG